jgi:hypothetical protein
MGRSHTLKWQVGRTYNLNKIFHYVYASGSREFVKKQSSSFSDVKIKKDEKTFFALIPYAPDMRNNKFEYYLKKYSNNNKKLNLVCWKYVSGE